MRILVACEFSGTVRDAFTDQGFDATSCDILPSEQPSGKHIQGDVSLILDQGWDLMIAHPPCTYLCSSGARWWHLRKQEQRDAIEFVKLLWNCGIPRIAIENPIGCLGPHIGHYKQIIQPWQHGHSQVKSTCLWLRGLPPLHPSNTVSGREEKCHRTPPSKNRWKIRSKTYSGIARAMAMQWGYFLRRYDGRQSTTRNRNDA